MLHILCAKHLVKWDLTWSHLKDSEVDYTTYQLCDIQVT